MAELVDRRNVVVTGAGRKGAGKTTLLWHRFACAFPRKITLDVSAEARELDPDVIEVVGPAELRRALRWVTQRGARAWHIGLTLEQSDQREVFALLAPRLAPGQVSVTRALGGVALVCGEIDDVAPNAGADPDVKAAWKRGRHHALSLLTATQRPAEMARVVSSQADVLFAIGCMDEPSEYGFWRRTISPAIADRIAALREHEAVIYHRDRRTVEHIDGAGKVLHRLDAAGRSL